MKIDVWVVWFKGNAEEGPSPCRTGWHYMIYSNKLDAELALSSRFNDRVCDVRPGILEVDIAEPIAERKE